MFLSFEQSAEGAGPRLRYGLSSKKGRHDSVSSADGLADLTGRVDWDVVDEVLREVLRRKTVHHLAQLYKYERIVRERQHAERHGHSVPAHLQQHRMLLTPLGMGGGDHPTADSGFAEEEQRRRRHDPLPPKPRFRLMLSRTELLEVRVRIKAKTKAKRAEASAASQ